jgi:two-component system cell cycle response regulator DivK
MAVARQQWSNGMARILLIEDTPSNVKLASLILEKAGHTLMLAEDAAAGIASAHDWEPDIILMDVQLPGMDGLTATRELKADPTVRHIPVLALTALAMKGDAEKAQAAGCDGYLAKPYHYYELIASIDRLLGH